jgi:D-alanyl-D-alanine carboxypeptidase
MTAISHRQIIEQSIAQEITDATPVALTLITEDHSCSTEVNCTPGDKPLFLAYSCTKTIIATLLLMLCEEGRCNLDASVSRWFPELPMAPAITIRHLLGHTSGLPDYGGLADYHQEVRRSPSRPWTDSEFLERTLAQGMLFKPGEGWAYSNIGYLLLKIIAMQEFSQPLASAVAARICDPLGLERSFIPESAADLTVLQPAFSVLIAENGVSLVPEVYHPGWVSHGVLASTPAELASYYHRLFTGKVLSSESLSAMTTLSPVPSAPPQYRAPCYGLGIMADTASPYGAILGHNGVGPGYQASVFHARTPEGRPMTVSAMCSSESPGLSERLVFRVFTELT